LIFISVGIRSVYQFTYILIMAGSHYYFIDSQLQLSIVKEKVIFSND